MCFTVNVNLVRDELENRYGVLFPENERYSPSYYYHAFGLPELPALCSEFPHEFRLLRWGLIPSWTRSPSDAEVIRYKTFNARAETIRALPSYSRSFKLRRCIIPVRGFFEWQHSGNEKIPYYIYREDGEIMSLAGIYDSWTGTTTGERHDTFSVITTDANDLLAVIHNSKKRMPVILDKEEEKSWISQTVTEDEAFRILKPCPSETLKAHMVSNLVNDRKANRNSPDVIRPFSRSQDTLFS